MSATVLLLKDIKIFLPTDRLKRGHDSSVISLCKEYNSESVDILFSKRIMRNVKVSKVISNFQLKPE